MMDLEIVQRELESADFVLKTQQQIAKDFGASGIDFPAVFRSVPMQKNQLIVEISKRLREVDSSDPNTLSQLLYQIDIPESILSDLAQTDDFHSSLAEVVLKREAYKVYLRAKFSS